MLSDLLNKNNIVINLESTDKDELFAEMVEVLIRTDSSLDRNQIMEALSAREALMNTCVKPGIAVPHCSVKGIENVMVVLGISKDGIEYDAKDALGLSSYEEALVHLVIMFVFNAENANEHLKTLAFCAHDFQSHELYKSLINSKSVDEVLNVIREFEER